jgi:predicted dinucleotide-binding enzyme
MNNTHAEKEQAMRTGVLGTGMVGQAIGSKLIQLGPRSQNGLAHGG